MWRWLEILRHLLGKWLSQKEKKIWLWLLCKWVDFNLIYRKTTHFFKGIMSAWTQRNRGSIEKPLHSQSFYEHKENEKSIQFKTRTISNGNEKKIPSVEPRVQSPCSFLPPAVTLWHISSSLCPHLPSHLCPILLYWSLLCCYFFSVNRVTNPHKHLERQGLKDVAAKSWGCRDTLHRTEVKAGWHDRRGEF